MNPQSHLFFSNALMWCVSGPERTVSDAIKLMEKERISYCVFYVPVPPNTDYEIEFFTPQVPGTQMLELVEYRKGRKVRTPKESK